MPYIFPDWPGLDFIVVAASCWRAGRWRRRRFYHGRPFNNRPHREVSSLLGIGKSETLFHSDVTKKSTTLIRNYLMTVQQSFFYYYFLLLVENAESQEEHKTFFENLKRRKISSWSRKNKNLNHSCSPFVSDWIAVVVVVVVVEAAAAATASQRQHYFRHFSHFERLSSPRNGLSRSRSLMTEKWKCAHTLKRKKEIRGDKKGDLFVVSFPPRW